MGSKHFIERLNQRFLADIFMALHEINEQLKNADPTEVSDPAIFDRTLQKSCYIYNECTGFDERIVSISMMPNQARRPGTAMNRYLEAILNLQKS